MNSRLLTAVVVIVATVSIPGGASADLNENDATATGSLTDQGDVVVGAGYQIERWHGSVGAGSPSAGPRCSWELAYIETVTANPGGVAAEAGEVAVYRDPVTEERVEGPGPGVEAGYYVRCPYGTGVPAFRWYAPTDRIDPALVAQAAIDEAVSHLPAPSMDMWPAPEFGAPAQLGLWLAVTDPGQLNATAQAGPVWASATARFIGTDWDMDNGDAVSCSGPGETRPANYGINEEGPCGYTYGAIGDVGVRHVTVSGTWEVQLVTSTGRDEIVGTADMATSFDYEVYEIQTVVVG